MGAVVEEEPLPGEPGAEVGPQQGEDPVLGGDLAAEDAVLVGEADKALEEVGLLPEVEEGGVEGGHPGVGQVPDHGGTRPVSQADEVVEPPLLLRGAGEETVADPLLDLGGDLPAQGAVHPLRLFPVGLHRPLRPQGGPGIVEEREAGRLLVPGVALKDAGEEAGEGAVVEVDELGALGHGHDDAPFRWRGRRGRAGRAAPWRCRRGGDRPDGRRGPRAGAGRRRGRRGRSR